MKHIDTLRIVSTLVAVAVFSVLGAASLGSEPKNGTEVEPVSAPPAAVVSRDRFYGTWHGRIDDENWTLRVTENQIVLGGVFGEMPTRYEVMSQEGGRLEVEQRMPEGSVYSALELSEDGSRLTYSSEAEEPMTFTRAGTEGATADEGPSIPEGATRTREAARAAIAARDFEALGRLFAATGSYELGVDLVVTRREAVLDAFRSRPESLAQLDRAFERACEADPPEDGQVFVTCGRSGIYDTLVVTLSNVEDDDTFVIVGIGHTH